MTHHLNVFLLLSGMLQGALLSSYLLKNKRKHQSNLFLVSFLVVVGVQLTFKVVSKVWLFDHVLLLYAFSYYLPFLVAPLFYFFVRVRSEGVLFRSQDVIHFLPFALGIVHQSLFVRFGTDYSSMVTHWAVDALPRAVVQMGVLVFYSWLSYKCVRGFAMGSVRSGLTQFLVIVFICESLIVIALAMMVDFAGLFPDMRLLFSALTFLIYWVSYKLMTHPELIAHNGDATLNLNAARTYKYINSGLKPQDADEIERRLKVKMCDEKLFLDAELTIDTLANTLQVSRHHLSQVLNERFDQSYYDYVSSLRLAEAGRRLRDEKYRHLTIAAIAFDSGFSSLSNFNDLFKKRFATTPSRFRRGPDHS